MYRIKATFKCYKLVSYQYAYFILFTLLLKFYIYSLQIYVRHPCCVFLIPFGMWAGLHLDILASLYKLS